MANCLFFAEHCLGCDVFEGVVMRLVSTLWLLALVSVVMTSACVTMRGTRVVMDVDCLARTDAVTKNFYVLVPGERGVDAGDLQFREFAAYVDRLLSEKGFVKVEDFQDADVAVLMVYAIGDPETYLSTYSTPVWGKTGVSSSETKGDVSSYGGRSTYSSSTKYKPSYGVTGYKTHVRTDVSFTRFLSLSAYDVSAFVREGRTSQVWSARVSSTGSTNDLRFVFPYMVAAMKPYLGFNTGRKIAVELSADDPRVLRVLRGQESNVE